MQKVRSFAIAFEARQVAYAENGWNVGNRVVGSDDEFLEALQKNYVSRRPWRDKNVKYTGEDGSNEDYLFVYLRSILAVLENADKQNLTTIYILEHPS